MPSSRPNPNLNPTLHLFFVSSPSQDLPFRKGDVLVIEKVTEDDNWLVATNAKGKRGMVPANYVVRWNRKGNDREREAERAAASA